MALDTYGGLKTAIQTWVARADLSTDVDDLIDLFEAWANRNLRVPQMETEAISSALEYMALPADFLALRDIQYQTNPVAQLTYLSPADADLAPADMPRYYTIVGDQLRIIGPPSGDIELRIDYWRKIPALSSITTTNWLLASHPDAYLYGSLIHANLRIINPELAASISSAWQQVMAEINTAGRASNFGSRIIMRPS